MVSKTSIRFGINKFGIDKSIGFSIEKFGIGFGIVQILGIVTHCFYDAVKCLNVILSFWAGCLVRAIDNACGQELGGFQTANLNHSEYIHIGQILIWWHTRKQCLPIDGHLYIHLSKARDGFGAVILKNHLCILAIVHPPNFWTIFRVIPSAGGSFQLFAQSCNSNQPSTKPHKNGQQCSFQKILCQTNTSQI